MSHVSLAIMNHIALDETVRIKLLKIFHSRQLLYDSKGEGAKTR